MPSLIKQTHVDDEDREFMAKAVELTEERHELYAVMRHIDAVQVAEAMGRNGDLIDLVYVFKRLHDEGPQWTTGVNRDKRHIKIRLWPGRVMGSVVGIVGDGRA